MTTGSTTTTSKPTRVWLITGAGRGLGRAFAQAALARGDRVIGTLRTRGALDDLAQRHPDSLRTLELDVRNSEAVRRVVDEAAALFGRLDVVVNNAGYGIVGAIEELAEDDVQDHLGTNLLGALWVTQAALPHLRGQGSGEIVQISTVGAVGSMPIFGLYNAGKWALEGFSEALAAEVAQFGIGVTIAELGGFATDWGGKSLHFAQPLTAYDDLRASLFGTPDVPWATSDTEASGEAGDAPATEAAAALLAHLDRAEDRPLRVLVGRDAPVHVSAALAQRRDDYARDSRFVWPSPSP